MSNTIQLDSAPAKTLRLMPGSLLSVKKSC